jgi:hypothetical protein
VGAELDTLMLGRVPFVSRTSGAMPARNKGLNVPLGSPRGQRRAGGAVGQDLAAAEPGPGIQISQG